MAMAARNRLAIAFAVTALAAAACAADTSSAIIRLLNSRASGSPRGYAEAAKTVAEDAAKGRPLQQFVLALVSEEKTAPEAARLSAAKRKEYLDASREKIKTLAIARDNGLAWYLLSLEEGNGEYLKRAADLKNVQALNAYGTMTLTQAFADAKLSTNELATVLGQCFACFKEAASQKDANGFYNLGMCYLNGYGCQHDDELAFNCFKTAAEMGHPEAINNLGGFYRDGVIVARDIDLATKCFVKSAAMDNAYGQLNYALALQRGEGTAKDPHHAYELLQAAVAQGNAEAMNVLGMAFYNGLGVDKDLAKAVQWYRRSAQLGFPAAMDNLSSCYELGFGVRESRELATVWRIRARAARGDSNAISWLKQNGYSLR